MTLKFELRNDLKFADPADQLVNDLRNPETKIIQRDHGKYIAGSPDYICKKISPNHRFLSNGEYLPMKNQPEPKIERVLVRANNVHDYFMKHYEEHGWNDLTKFTCAKPPYPEMVVTYDHDFLRIEGGVYAESADHSKNLISRHIDVEVTERSMDWFSWYLTKESNVSFNGFAPFSEEESEKARLNMIHILDGAQPATMLEIKVHADLRQFPGRFFVMLGERGQVLEYQNYAYFFIQSPGELEAISLSSGKNLKWTLEKFEGSYARHACIVLATLQFMNCKNVEVVEHAPSRQQRREAERQNRKAPVTYKTLTIHPVGKRHKYTKMANALQHGVALHIVRGHFKDYRNGRGLGRGHGRGIWWWDAQVRGEAERGRVVKDYDVATEEK